MTDKVSLSGSDKYRGSHFRINDAFKANNMYSSLKEDPYLQNYIGRAEGFLNELGIDPTSPDFIDRSMGTIVRGMIETPITGNEKCQQDWLLQDGISKEYVVLLKFLVYRYFDSGRLIGYVEENTPPTGASVETTPLHTINRFRNRIARFRPPLRDSFADQNGNISTGNYFANHDIEDALSILILFNEMTAKDLIKYFDSYTRGLLPKGSSRESNFHIKRHLASGFKDSLTRVLSSVYRNNGYANEDKYKLDIRILNNYLNNTIGFANQ